MITCSIVIDDAHHENHKSDLDSRPEKWGRLSEQSVSGKCQMKYVSVYHGYWCKCSNQTLLQE